MALLELDADGNVLVADQTDLNGASAGGTANPYPAGVTPMTVAQQLAAIALGANTITQMETDFDQFMVDRQAQVDLALESPHVHGDGGVGSQIIAVKTFSQNTVGSAFIHIKLPKSYKHYRFDVLSHFYSADGVSVTSFYAFGASLNASKVVAKGGLLPEVYVGSDSHTYCRLTVPDMSFFSMSINAINIMASGYITDYSLLDVQSSQVEYL